MIPLAKQYLSEDTYKSVEQVLRSGWWTMGHWTQQLEQEFAEYKNVKHAIAVNSCSSALLLAVKACIKNGGYKAVLTTPITFCSTVNAIIFNKLTPYFIDVDRQTKCIDLNQVPHNGRLYYQGIVLVHFAGHPCDMDRLNEIKKNNPDLWVIEDCAHAVEGKWNGQHLGTFGDVGCFSFNPTKNLAAPEMGMVITNDDRIAEKIRIERLHGMTVDAFDRINKPGQYDIKQIGYKFNCTDLESVIALHQLRELENNWLIRLMIVYEYEKYLLESKDFYNGQTISSSSTKGKNAFHLFQIELNNRDKFIIEMRHRGIYCGIHYKPVHKLSYYKDKYYASLPNAEYHGDHTVSLPLGPGMNNLDVDYVINNMNDLLSTKEYLL